MATPVVFTAILGGVVEYVMDRASFQIIGKHALLLGAAAWVSNMIYDSLYGAKGPLAKITEYANANLLGGVMTSGLYWVAAKKIDVVSDGRSSMHVFGWAAGSAIGSGYAKSYWDKMKIQSAEAAA
jgi:hypothetical protein